MKKFVFAAVAVLSVMLLTLCLNAQPAGGGMGGFGGGAGGGFGGGGGGMGGFGGGAGGGMGMRGARGPVQRPDKAARLASIAELEKQIATLKEAIQKAPAKDTEVTAESDEATIQKATEERQAETDAIAAIQTTLGALRGQAAAGGGRGGRGGFGGGASTDVLSELRVIAKDEKATKTIAKLDALIKEALTTGGARGNRGGRGGGAGMMGGGMMGGGAGGAGGMMGGGAGGGRGGRGGAGGA